MRKIHISILILTLIIILPWSYAVSGEITDLSKKASEINIRMPKKTVIRLLGRPTWAVIPSDGGEFAIRAPAMVKLELFWKNIPCSPVIVSFNSAYRVVGQDEGWGFCGKDAHITEPTNEYLCGKADRAKFCR